MYKMKKAALALTAALMLASAGAQAKDAGDLLGIGVLLGKQSLLHQPLDGH